MDKSLVTDLATCQYITKGESIVITGATGCGKSFLASVLGYEKFSMWYYGAVFISSFAYQQVSRYLSGLLPSPG